MAARRDGCFRCWSAPFPDPKALITAGNVLDGGAEELQTRLMFTGIVEEKGRVTALEKREGALALTIASTVAREGAALGDSIAVEGVCLTVTELSNDGFSFEAVPETLKKTHMGDWTVGQVVNLERAMTQGRPFGGHYVQGHVDGVAKILRRVKDGEAVNVSFQADASMRPFIVEKGFVALDGVSLTIVNVVGDGAQCEFTVTFVPHTQSAVTVANKPLGAGVNLEVDVTGKYILGAMEGHLRALTERIERLEKQISGSERPEP